MTLKQILAGAAAFVAGAALAAFIAAFVAWSVYAVKMGAMQ